MQPCSVHLDDGASRYYHPAWFVYSQIDRDGAHRLWSVAVLEQRLHTIRGLRKQSRSSCRLLYNVAAMLSSTSRFGKLSSEHAGNSIVPVQQEKQGMKQTLLKI